MNKEASTSETKLRTVTLKLNTEGLVSAQNSDAYVSKNVEAFITVNYVSI